MGCQRPDAVLKLARRDHILWGGCGRYNPPNSARSSNKTNSMQHLASPAFFVHATNDIDDCSCLLRLLRLLLNGPVQVVRGATLDPTLSRPLGVRESARDVLRADRSK